MGNWQTVQTQIRCCRMQCQGLHCLQLSHFPVGISKSHSLAYLKLKFDSSNIWCGVFFWGGGGGGGGGLFTLDA